MAQRFGIPAAFWWGRVLDAMAVACLVGLGLWMGLGYPYLVGCGLVAGLLAYKYALISPKDLSRLGVAFARTNAYVSTVVLIATLAAVLLY